MGGVSARRPWGVCWFAEGLPMRRILSLAIALSGLPGCINLDQASEAPATPHPVSDTPVVVVPDAQELPLARQTAPTPGEREVPALMEEEASAVARGAEASWAVTVIRLEHAKAEAVAETLSRIVPPGVGVVAYPPTNSLIIWASSSPPGPIAPE